MTPHQNRVPGTQKKTKRTVPGTWIFLLAIIMAGSLGCSTLSPPEQGYPRPANMTEEALEYSNCINEAISAQYGQVYSRQDNERYIMASCRLMEPQEALSPIPNCRDQYFNWFQSHHQKMGNVIPTMFAATVCAAPPAGRAP